MLRQVSTQLNAMNMIQNGLECIISVLCKCGEA